MIDPREPAKCTRCHATDRPDRFRLSLVNHVREAREDGRPFTPPYFGHELRCRDREACRERVQANRERSHA